ncbi:hypothetical protein LAZ67_23001365 [Cordylochernes scorpioides]|uniref:Transposase n=1 Tax=Cordylochernes scorpioides TaxID=51811 RepID=A0ABY6LQL5_9ARAC|nr:hypothetical protein LAZ67_23001365 [Cordylochernes scorpioides]
MMPQPPYSPDLAPCDFFLFPKLKRPIKRRRYATLDEMKTASKEELKKIFKNEFLKCFEDWKNRWHKSVGHLTAALVAAVLVSPCLRGFMQDAELSSVIPQLPLVLVPRGTY